MTPIAHFEALWDRCAQISALHSYLANNTTSVLSPDELLRAEWVARLSALDLYVHELVAQRMLAIFEGRRPATPAYLRFQISSETLNRIRSAVTPVQASAAFDLDVRTQLGYISYQDPDKIADGVRLCSSVELWNEVATKLGATPGNRIQNAKRLKKNLSILVQRRNRIAHEGDLKPTPVREPWPVAKSDLVCVAEQIEAVVRAVDSVV